MMGRPPSHPNVGLKKGPWTPEEDIILVTCINEHGAGNWRAVPTNTGLRRCSKSCRLRWTNYLRPGIKRGNFTEREDNMIIQLQALLGNRWAAIATYLPQRTDNDIKNYWNTHLNKKLNKRNAGASQDQGQGQWRGVTYDNNQGNKSSESMDPITGLSSKGQWEMKLQTNIHMAKLALEEALSVDKSNSTASDDASHKKSQTTTPFSSSKSLTHNSSDYPNLHISQPTIKFSSNKPQTRSSSSSSTGTAYASSTDNIARLLETWVKPSPKGAKPSYSYETISNSDVTHEYSSFSNDQLGNLAYNSEGFNVASLVNNNPRVMPALDEAAVRGGAFDQFVSCNSSSGHANVNVKKGAGNGGSMNQVNYESGPNIMNAQRQNQMGSFGNLEDWLLDDANVAMQRQDDLMSKMPNFGPTSHRRFY